MHEGSKCVGWRGGQSVTGPKAVAHYITECHYNNKGSYCVGWRNGQYMLGPTTSHAGHASHASERVSPGPSPSPSPGARTNTRAATRAAKHSAERIRPGGPSSGGLGLGTDGWCSPRHKMLATS